jgi:hypothetical protein
MQCGLEEGSDKWQGQRFLRHDNAPSHTSPVEQQYLTEKNIPVITQAPLSGSRSKSLWLFPTLKIGHKGTCFTSVEDIKWNAMAELQKVPYETFCRYFQQWQD